MKKAYHCNQMFKTTTQLIKACSYFYINDGKSFNSRTHKCISDVDDLCIVIDPLYVPSRTTGQSYCLLFSAACGLVFIEHFMMEHFNEVFNENG